MCTQQSALMMQGVGSVSSAMGAYTSAQASQAGLRAQANIDDINARTAENFAQNTLVAGERDVQRSQFAAAALKSRQRANLAANGVDLGVGSAAEVLTSTDVMSEIDANTLQANAVRAAWGYRTQKTNYLNDAASKRAGASAISPFGAAASTLIGGAGAVAKSWYEMSKTTPGPAPFTGVGAQPY